MKNNKEYHFFTASTANYHDNNFQELVDEEKNNGNVYWHINIGTKGYHKVKEGDICYIYYSNLPDQSSRIFFVGNVIASDYNDKTDTINEKSIFKDAKKYEKYIELNLKCIAFDDPERFSLNNLRYKYKLIPEKGQFSYLHVDKEKHKKLIYDIDEALSEGYKRLSTIHNLFNDKFCVCTFKDVFKCQTFQEENGFNYIERHHLVERNLIKKNKDNEKIEELINNKDNLFLLCPTCHRRIHHATIEERKYMIKYLYNQRKKFYDNNFNELKDNKDTLEWLYDMYNVVK